MRGTRGLAGLEQRDAGIIPAYAGNTGELAKMLRQNGDHPRVCGEHLTCVTTLLLAAGSSPRMRGTHSPSGSMALDTGIIPAYAGNTLRDYSNFVVSKFMSFVFHLV